MSGFGAPPVIPPEFQPYNSYLIDPQWQLKFSIIWSSALGFFVLLSVPRIIRAVSTGRGPYDFRNWIGIKEHHDSARVYDFLVDASKTVKHGRSWALSRYLDNVAGVLTAFLCLTIPKVGLNLGQVILLVSYTLTVFLCIVRDSKLIENPNRAGFLSVAQLPVVFLFSTKNSIFSFLLGPGVGYEKLNFLHRWSGRVMFLSALLHGALWIRSLVKNEMPILGQKKETTGIIAFSFLALIVLVSLRPGRKYFYQAFFNLHLVFAVAFYVAILYHTPYAVPWVYLPLAIYGLDILLRMLRYRFKDAVLVPVGNQMTLVHIPHATFGWVAGQHIRLRIFISGRIFESHPFTIFSATPDLSCITSMPPGLSLGVRVAGDWTRALNSYAKEMRMMEESPIRSDSAVVEKREFLELPVQVLIDGPYGGASIDLGDYETVLLVSGGSGITFTLGLLDDIVGRCIRKGRMNGEKTKRIELSWCIRSFGQLNWFSSAFTDIANTIASSGTSPCPLYLHISVYVTCLCNPDAVPSIPNCDVMVLRPSIYHILRDLTNVPKDYGSATGSTDPDSKQPDSRDSAESKSDPVRLSTEIILIDEEENIPSISQKLPWVEPGGGLAVCASGPAGLTSETANAVSRLQLSEKGREFGMIGLHTEVFAL